MGENESLNPGAADAAAAEFEAGNLDTPVGLSRAVASLEEVE